MTSQPPITSHSNQTIKAVKRLRMRKAREEEGTFVIEGVRHLFDAVEAGWVLRIVLFDPSDLARPKTAELIEKCRASGATCLEVSRDVMAGVAKRDNPETVIAVAEQRLYELDALDVSADKLAIVLEEIRDPGNLGTIARTADAVGAYNIVLVGSTCDPFSPEAVRASMGSFARIRFTRASLEDFQIWRAGWSGQVVGAHLEGAVDYRQANTSGPLILAMGTEQAGLSDTLSRTCDELVRIPMVDGVDSLNLAISTGVLLYQIRASSGYF